MSELPATVIDYFGTGVVDAGGTWGDGGIYQGTAYLALTPEDSDELGERTIRVYVRSPDPELFFVMGDPDSRDWLEMERP